MFIILDFWCMVDQIFLSPQKKRSVISGNKTGIRASLICIAFSAPLMCCLTYLWILLQVLPSCGLIHSSIVKMRELLYYLCSCIDVGVLLKSYLCHLFFICTFIFIMTNHIISWIQTHLSFCLFFITYPIIFGNNMDEKYD